jgi:hypothetical protein
MERNNLKNIKKINLMAQVTEACHEVKLAATPTA